MKSLKGKVNEITIQVAANPKWLLVDVYIDIASSKTGSSRKEFTRMLKDCQSRDLEIIFLNMNYHYKIGIVDEKEKWIFISHDDWDEIDAFVNLIRNIQNDCNGKIIEVGDTQYRVEGSIFDLIYQWDSCFGSVVIYNRTEQKEPVIEFLQAHFDKLNV